MIKLENIAIHFNHRVVLDINKASFEQGCIHGIVGLNGAGKTTFYQVMAGNYKVKDSSLSIGTLPLGWKHIAYLETNNYFYSKLTGKDHLNIFETSMNDFDQTMLAKLFDLPLNNLIETYSTGMKKKLAFLAILKQNRDVFLLDEPFNGLDIESNKLVELVVRKLKDKGKTVFISSHVLGPLLSLCDKVHLLEQGKFTQSFSKENFEKIEQELLGKFAKEKEAIIAKAMR